MAGDLKIVIYAISKIVRINEILAGIIRRINVDQFHLARVALLQELQNLKVVATDDEKGLLLVSGAVPGPRGGYVIVKDASKRARHKDAPYPAGLRKAAAEAAPAAEAPAAEGPAA